MSQGSASSTQAMNGSVTSTKRASSPLHNTNPSQNSRTQIPSHTNSQIATYLQSSTPYTPYTTTTTTTTDEAIQSARQNMASKISEFDNAFEGRESR
ncbi:hypothetical protein HYALB_00012370 [Hymenoscyphus albidus]|uniref:Uncharacterized protein n=1 Tax=Hymenoscyphus albidus TaxID=595503 RepID=A0A9N9Q966_9HELO|nr:hypothetical protein HYALB_00012370 [Hymenoscyphus albidus]